MTADAVNGAFEGLAGFVVLVNCRRVMIDRKVAGVSAYPTAFFLAWGVWNLYYYPHLDQIWSFWGGVGVVVSNLLYVVLLVRYRK